MNDSYLSILSKYLKDELQVGARPVCLVETDPKSSFKQVTLNGGRSLVLRLDQGTARELLPFFKGEPGILQVCDYVVFHEVGDALYGILVECKSSGNNAMIRKGIEQVHATAMLVEYLVQRIFWQEGRPVPSIQLRGVIFHGGGVLPRDRTAQTGASYQANQLRARPMKFVFYRDGVSYPLSHFCT